MKILYVWHAAVEKEYRKIFSEIMKNGIDLIVITAKKWFEASRLQNFEFSEDDRNYLIYPLATIFTNHIRAFFYLNVFKIVKILLRHKPDVIYINEEPYSTASFVLIFLSKVFLPKSKIVIQSSENIFKTHPFPFNFFEKFSLSNIDALSVVPTEGIKVYKEKGFKKQIFKVSYFMNTEKFYILPKGEVVKKLPEIEFDGLKVGFVGRVSEEKGVDTIIEAINYLKNKGKNSVKLFIVGKEIPEYFSFLKRKIKECYLEENVKFLGSFGYDKLLYFYNNIDCLVLPSRTKVWWKEQFGRVIVESMACGTPVIGSDSGEIPIIIDNPELIFKEDDYIALANILEKFYDGILTKEKLADSLVEKSKKYSVEEVVKTKVEIFKKVLGKPYQ